MSSHLQAGVGGSAAAPDRAIGLRPRLARDAARTLIYDWNPLSGDWPRSATIHRLFEEQVRRTPGAVAVSFEDEDLTYTGLNERANRLARLLRVRYLERHGTPMPPDTPVGLCLERGPEMIVSMLAVLKAGGAYVPVDPDYPRDRIDFILRDSEVPLVVSQSGALDRVPFMTLAGLGDREVDCTLTGARAQIKDLDRLPLPDRYSIDISRYRTQIHMAMVKDSVAVQASRGCPYMCAYCHKIWPRSQVFRSAEHIFSEIEHYWRTGVRRFAFVDDIFNLNRKVSTRLFRMLIDSPLDVELFFPNGLRADLLTEDYMDLMVEAGTVSVAMALESASPRLQRLVRKNLDLDRVRASVDYMARAHPEVMLELFAMIGFPTETEEEALSTLEFIERTRWLHFPYLHVLKVYPGTDMATLAMEQGVSREAIYRSLDLAFHELPETLPFDKGFARMLQARFLNEYFLNRERLLATIPCQKRVLTEDEFVRKYDSYLPVPVDDLAGLLDLCGLTVDDTGPEPFPEESDVFAGAGKSFAFPAPRPDAMRIMLLDLSQRFSTEEEMLYDVVEEPLGLLYLASYLREFYGDEVQLRVAKSRIDFDSFEELRALVDEFQPRLIGIRTLTFFRGFFHRTAALLKTWALDVPIVAGGPYATSDYRTLLADSAIDLAVLGEGEVTFAELVGALMENGGRLPEPEARAGIAGLACAAGGRAERNVVLLDEETGALESQAGDDLQLEGSPGDAAYVIYTSGSTGTPKGVVLEHRNVVRLLFNDHLPFEFGSDDAWSMFHSYCFDFSVWEMYGALLLGGRLVVVPRGVARDPEAFLHLLSREGVTVLNQTPGAFYNLMRFAVEEAPPPALRYVIFGGEALNVAALEPWFAAFGDEKPLLVNMFGITETCVHVTYRALDARDALTPGLGSPLGRALPDLTTYVLDGNLNPLPVGVPGELFVGGEGVARGYLGRPELTAERFVDNPYIDERTEESFDNRRLYRSGDMARWRPGGELEYMGRTDFQIKVRGFRVEPGEIAAALLRHPGIAGCAVMQLGEEDGGRLACYYVPEKSSGEMPHEELKSFLAANLPDYMVPGLFVALAEMPLTEHGKTDRRALPVPGRMERASRVEFVEPRDEDERLLARIWREVLKVDRVGVNDDFFALGGDSIMSIQVISKARHAGLKVTPKQLFADPTVAGMARVAVRVDAAPEVERPRPEGSAPLSPIQRWFFEQGFENPNHYNQAFLLSPAAKLDTAALRKAVEAVTAEHDAFRLRFCRDGEGGWRQRYQDGPCQIPVTEVEGVADAAGLEEACSRVQAGLDIEKGPVAAACVVRGAEGPERLLIAVHHLVVDGVSWRILLEDLEAAYARIAAGGPPELPYRSDSFKAWCEWLEVYAKSGPTARQMPFWLEAAGDGTSLAPDTEGGEPLFGESIERRVTLDTSATARLVSHLPGARGSGIEDLLVSALVLAVARLRPVRRLRLHMEGHGREDLGSDLDLTRTVGWFTSLYPVSIDIPSLAADDVLASVRDGLRAVPDGGIGYGALRYLGGDDVARALDADGAPTVSFNYLGRMDAMSDGMLVGAEPVPAPGMMWPGNRNPHLVDCWGMVTGGRLEIRLILSARHFATETADALATLYEQALDSLAKLSVEPSATRLSPSEFPGTTLTRDGLDAIARLWGADRIDSIYPLSPLQEGLLFHSRYAPHSDQYVEQLIWRYEGDLNRDVLKRVWQDMFERHAVFRTAFAWDDLEEPVQVVLSGLEPDWREYDWRGVPATDLPGKLEDCLAADRAEGFEPERPPLVRLHLLRTADDEYRFVWTHHHLLLDGWSMSLVMDELRERYAAEVEGRPPEVAPSPPFEEYVRSIGAADREEALAFWTRTMAGVEEATPLAFARSGIRVDTREPIRNLIETVHHFSPGLTGECRRFARRRRVTLNSLIQLSWAVVLGRFCGTDDVVMGMTISGRAGEVEGVERMVGLLINTVPLPFRVGGDTAAVHLRRLHGLVQEVNDSGFLTLTDIHRCSGVAPGDPLFSSLFLFENYPVEEQEGDVAIREIDFREKTNYPLTVVVVPGERMSVKISWDGDAFSAGSIERIGLYMENAVRWIMGHPDEPLALADIMPEEDRVLVLETWSRNEAPRPGRGTLLDMFADAVAAHGGETALTFRDESVTYGELDRRSDSLATALSNACPSCSQVDGQGGGLVGLMTERSIEMVVGMLAAMKAGAAYLPLDVEYPDSRLEFLIDDARLGAVLVQELHEARLKALLGDSDIAVVRLDQAAEEHPLDRPGPGDLAYAIYTSGSTGTPKGAAIEHRSVVNLIEWMMREYPLGPGDTFLQLTSFTFDVSVAEVFWTLCSGARLLLAEPHASMDIGQVLATIRDDAVTAAGFVPSLFGVFTEAAAESGPGYLDGLKYVHVAGEAFPTPLAERFSALSPVRLDNIYGPTEATVYSAYYPYRGDIALPVLPIGRPVANAKLLVLDSRMRPVPPEVPGELFIGGDCLARGYLYREELSAERFIPDPFEPQGPGARLYRTGDLARWLPDGQLEFLGRQDFQVKVRGFRVEPQEIEIRLRSHPAVDRCVVVTRGESGDRALAAYYTTKPGEASPTAGGLSEFVADCLPDYMVPSSFVHLDRMPLHPSGKLDRRALPEPDAATRRERYAGPRDEIEERLAEVFAEILGQDRVGIDDDFFTMGGHSLLAARLMFRVNRLMSMDLPVSAVFERRTVRRLGDLIREGPGAGGRTDRITVEEF